MKIWMTLLFTAALSAGCSLAPEYRQPRQEIPETWCEPAPRKEPSVLDCAAPEVEYASLSRQWWKRFQDKALDALIEKALAPLPQQRKQQLPLRKHLQQSNSVAAPTHRECA